MPLTVLATYSKGLMGNLDGVRRFCGVVLHCTCKGYKTV